MWSFWLVVLNLYTTSLLPSPSNLSFANYNGIFHPWVLARNVNVIICQAAVGKLIYVCAVFICRVIPRTLMPREVLFKTSMDKSCIVFSLKLANHLSMYYGQRSRAWTYVFVKIYYILWPGKFTGTLRNCCERVLHGISILVLH